MIKKRKKMKFMRRNHCYEATTVDDFKILSKVPGTMPLTLESLISCTSGSASMIKVRRRAWNYFIAGRGAAILVFSIARKCCEVRV